MRGGPCGARRGGHRRAGSGGGGAGCHGEDAAPAADAPADPEAGFLSFQSSLAQSDADTACGLLAPSAVEQVEDAGIGGSCEDWVEELLEARLSRGDEGWLIAELGEGV